jgi:hypothetical protein
MYDGLDGDFYFMSHSWSEDFGKSMQSLYRHSLDVSHYGHDEALHVAYWCCAFVINQHAIDLGCNIAASPFYVALNSDRCLGTVMNVDYPFLSTLQRVWCLYETLLTHVLEKPFTLNTVEGPLGGGHATPVVEAWTYHLNNMLQSVDVRKAQTSNEHDKMRIMREVCQYKDQAFGTGAGALNARIQSLLASVSLPMIAKAGCIEGVRMALASRANPDATDGRQIAALTYATAGDHREIINVLLLAGANADGMKNAREVVTMWAPSPQEREAAIKTVQASRVSIHSEAVQVAWKHHLHTEVKEAVENLKATEPDIRTGACQALGALGTEAASHSVGVVACLWDFDPNVREAAVLAIRQFHKDDAKLPSDAIDRIALALRAKRAEVRLVACLALGSIGEQAAEYLKAVAMCMRDEIGTVRLAACVSLNGLGVVLAAPYASLTAELLDDMDAEVCNAACAALAPLGEAAKPHITSLATRSVDVGATGAAARAALDTLRRAGVAMPPEAAFCVAQALDDERCKQACQALGALGATATPHIQAIANKLDAESSDTRKAACEALATIGAVAGTQGSATIKALAERAVLDNCSSVRHAACLPLSRLQESDSCVPTEAASRILQELGNSSPTVRGKACVALAKLGKAARCHMQSLVEMCLHDDDGGARDEARRAMSMLSADGVELPHDASSRVSTALGAPKPCIRRRACGVLRVLGRARTDHMLLMPARLRDESTDVRRAACEACAEICGKSSCVPSEVGDALAMAAADDDIQLRRRACAAIGPVCLARRSAAAPEAIALAMCLCDVNIAVRYAALSAFHSIADAGLALPPRAVLHVVEALNSKRADVRLKACEALAASRVAADPADLHETVGASSRCTKPMGTNSGALLSRAAHLLGKKATQDEKEGVRKGARAALVRLAEVGDMNGCTSVGLESVSDALHDQRWHVRAEACNVLSEFGSASAPHMATIAERLNDEHARVRVAACKALVASGGADIYAGALAECSKENSGEVNACRQPNKLPMGGLASHHFCPVPPSTDSLPRPQELPLVKPPRRMSTSHELLASTTSGRTFLRAMSCKLNTLTAGLYHTSSQLDPIDDTTSSSASGSHSDIMVGTATQTTAAALEERLCNDSDSSRRVAALSSVPHLTEATLISSTEAAALAALATRDGCWEIRCAACEVLGKLGSGLAAPHVAALAALMCDVDVRVRQAASRALLALCSGAACLTMGAAEVSPPIMAALCDERRDVRRRMCEALGAHGAAASQYREALIVRFGDGDVDVSKAASEALTSLGSGAPGKPKFSSGHARSGSSGGSSCDDGPGLKR